MKQALCCCFVLIINTIVLLLLVIFWFSNLLYANMEHNFHEIIFLFVLVILTSLVTISFQIPSYVLGYDRY